MVPLYLDTRGSVNAFLVVIVHNSPQRRRERRGFFFSLRPQRLYGEIELYAITSFLASVCVICICRL